MPQFCIRFPETVDGEMLADQFREYAEEGTDGPFKVSITGDQVLDYDGIVERAQDPAFVEALRAANEYDEARLERSRDRTFGTPPKLTAPDLFLQYKPGVEARVTSKRLNSVKDFFMPLVTSFRVAYDEAYRSLNEDTQRVYTEEQVDAFEAFGEELYRDLGYDPDTVDEIVTEDLYRGEDADHAPYKGAVMGGNPGGRSFL